MQRLSIKQVGMAVLVGILLLTTGTALGTAPAAQPASADMALGETGVSYRLDQTIGVTGLPYPVDAAHLYGPRGMLIDREDNLYVVEQANGQRLLRYNYNFLNTLSIGRAGVAGFGEGLLNAPADLAIRREESLWVVMDSAVKEFSLEGVELQIFPDETVPITGTDSTHFNDPLGIAFDANARLLVADTGNHRVQVYNMTTGTPVYSTTIGTTGVPGLLDGQFNRPTQIAVDSFGYLYITDSLNHRVQRCGYVAPRYVCITLIGEAGVAGTDVAHLNTPLGITVDLDDLYIADSGNYRVLKCNRDTRVCTQFAGVTGVPGSDDDHFSLPADVVVDSKDNVFVSDLSNHRIQVFDLNKELVKTLGVTLEPYATDETYFYRPSGAALDAIGNLFVLEKDGRRLVKVDPTGAIVWQYGEAGLSGAAGSFLGSADAGPEGKPAVSASGLVYFTDSPRHRVLMVKPGTTEVVQAGITDMAGADNTHFDFPAGAAINPLNGDVYVLDRGNTRLQVYSGALVYKGTVEAAELCGALLEDCLPQDLAFDAAGNLFLADAGNYIVKKCTGAVATGYTCAKFAGTTGVAGTDFDHLTPVGVAVDGKGRVLVADGGAGQRVQVYNAAGAYLTTLGGDTNPNSKIAQFNGGFLDLAGVAVSASGSVYAVDLENFRLQQFKPGYPGWVQTNLNGFGNPAQGVISTLEVFDDSLYAGTWYGFSSVYRTTDGKTWSKVNPSWTVTALGGAAVFGGDLYLGAYAIDGATPVGEIWRTDGATWERVVENGFADPGTPTVVVWINELEVFNGKLYAVTENMDTGMQVWYSATGEAGDWTQTGGDYLDATSVSSQKVLYVYNNALYLGRGKGGAAELWRSTDGDVWEKVTYLEPLNPKNDSVSALAEFNGKLYAGFRNEVEGGELWVSEDGLSFSKVFGGGMGDATNLRPYGLVAYNNELYLTFSNEINGADVYKSADGSTWTQVMNHGWGDWNNTYASFFDKNNAVFKGSLYFASINTANGGEVWRMLHLFYMPVVNR